MLKGVDNLVLIALIEWGRRFGTQAALAEALQLAPANLSRSLQRLYLARLIQHHDLSPTAPHVEEYLFHGLRYIFPAHLGSRVRGVPTAHSAPPLADQLSAGDTIVWAAEFGTSSGQALPPLHGNIPALCVAHPELHPTFALLDAIRLGPARERKLAQHYLAAWLNP